MKLPRDLSDELLAQALKSLGYQIDRQTGSHIRLTTQQNGEHHVTIPNHSPIKVGTLNSILKDIAQHFNLTRDQLVERLF
ncbi:MAG: type II toxin-antitoxin system HicA family toxin [Drouetiella hepatica Uher 2000/2452]|jgi:predicted RNA binding protein YcfA (HicA-like mRNA interferase family)|uniref:Type II toxin-antitoxin system HicA family toxin n=1 Tax=Drouetiella hepatica Uher 2000/2452 TaxID=904376 RepID=A0A951UMW6_9CYAN|nr:type II toxin-antitoxin system HicA family toxin [Drouetiella hepatica Uher 2000/2452]